MIPPTKPISTNQQHVPSAATHTVATTASSFVRNTVDLADLTRRYARYSRSAGGIAAIIGGALCIAMFVFGLTVELTPTLRIVLASAPLVWIASKEVLTRTYYQRFGRVEQRISAKERRAHLSFTLFITLISFIILVGVFVKYGLSGLTWPLMGSMAITFIMPFVVWRWMWSNSDFIVGVSMLCQSAVILNGGNYSLNFLGYYMIGAGLLSIAMGIKEHIEYKQLYSELFESQESRQASVETEEHEQ